MEILQNFVAFSEYMNFMYEQWAHVFHTLSIFLPDTKAVLIVEFQVYTQLSNVLGTSVI